MTDNDDFAKRPPFVLTATAKDILRSMQLVSTISGAGMTMISGAPGVGKTCTIFNFIEGNADIIHITAAKGEGHAYGQAENLLGHFNQVSKSRSLTKLRLHLIEELQERDLTLIVDESQYLSEEGIEWLRALCEAALVNLIFVGDLKLRVLIEGIPQLQSRMCRPVIIPAVKKRDVSDVAKANGFEDKDIIDTLFRIACLEGGMRNVENVMRTTMLFSGSEQSTVEHVKAAIFDMKLSLKGGV